MSEAEGERGSERETEGRREREFMIVDCWFMNELFSENGCLDKAAEFIEATGVRKLEIGSQMSEGSEAGNIGMMG